MDASSSARACLQDMLDLPGGEDLRLCHLLDCVHLVGRLVVRAPHLRSGPSEDGHGDAMTGPEVASTAAGGETVHRRGVRALPVALSSLCTPTACRLCFPPPHSASPPALPPPLAAEASSRGRSARQSGAAAARAFPNAPSPKTLRLQLKSARLIELLFRTDGGVVAPTKPSPPSALAAPPVPSSSTSCPAELYVRILRSESTGPSSRWKAPLSMRTSLHALCAVTWQACAAGSVRAVNVAARPSPKQAAPHMTPALARLVGAARGRRTVAMVGAPVLSEASPK